VGRTDQGVCCLPGHARAVQAATAKSRTSSGRAPAGRSASPGRGCLGREQYSPLPGAALARGSVAAPRANFTHKVARRAARICRPTRPRNEGRCPSSTEPRFSVGCVKA
jgi:hypothetical protein